MVRLWVFYREILSLAKTVKKRGREWTRVGDERGREWAGRERKEEESEISRGDER